MTNKSKSPTFFTHDILLQANPAVTLLLLKVNSCAYLASVPFGILCLLLSKGQPLQEKLFHFFFVLLTRPKPNIYISCKES